MLLLSKNAWPYYCRHPVQSSGLLTPTRPGWGISYHLRKRGTSFIRTTHHTVPQPSRPRPLNPRAFCPVDHEVPQARQLIRYKVSTIRWSILCYISEDCCPTLYLPRICFHGLSPSVSASVQVDFSASAGLRSMSMNMRQLHQRMQHPSVFISEPHKCSRLCQWHT